MEIFLFATASIQTLGPSSLIQWLLEIFTLEGKQPGHEADHSPTSNSKVKNSWSYTSTPPISLHGVVLN
jgi:hypothetical protein